MILSLLNPYRVVHDAQFLQHVRDVLYHYTSEFSGIERFTGEVDAEIGVDKSIPVNLYAAGSISSRDLIEQRGEMV